MITHVSVRTDRRILTVTGFAVTSDGDTVATYVIVVPHTTVDAAYVGTEAAASFEDALISVVRHMATCRAMFETLVL